MPRPSRPWFRFYVEAVHDRKIRRLTPAQRWVWVAILSAARQSPEPGELLVARGVPMTRQELADYAGVRVREINQAIVEMEALGMVGVNGCGSLSVCNWSARQFESDDVAIRTAEHRSRERSEERSNNGGGNAPETETEAEAEERAPKRRATQIPDGWEPSEATKEWARKEFPAHAKRGTVEHFRDWCVATGKPYRNFDLAFRNWIRNDAKWHPAPETKGPGRTHL